MKKEIAIIGIAVKVANAENIEDFWRFVECNETAFKPLSELRCKDVFDRFGKFEIATASFLNRIDLFDNDFFGILPSEAVRMDPEQRLMMQTAVKAVYNAGYSINELKGQRIGIFHTVGPSEYRRFFDNRNEYSHAAHMPTMLGSRIANFFDWRGPVIGIDTACSSSLSALYYGCESLASGDCTMALVGGANLEVTSVEQTKQAPIMSKKMQCLPFDKDADGTLGGEGVFCFLLKPADAARRDKDCIHAIIKGGAINHGGAAIQNISAPNPASQTEVIRLAWKNSNIPAERVRFIEAQGTGTLLGDAIEFQALSAAFEGLSEKGHRCSISSVKGQIGHLGPVSGLAGLLRLTLALKNKQLPAQLGFKHINPHISTKDQFVTIQEKTQYWQSDKPRIGGVSSLGRTGTNVHMIVQEYNAPSPMHNPVNSFAIKVGGATSAQANSIKEYMQQYLKLHPDVDLGCFCYSINKMLENHVFGKLVVFREKAELQSILDNNSPLSRRIKSNDQRFFLFVPGLIKQEWEADIVNSFIAQYEACKLVMDAGFHPDMIIGAGMGKLIAQLLMKQKELSAILNHLGEYDEKKDDFNYKGFINFLDSLDQTKEYLFIVVGNEGEMIPVLKNWLSSNVKYNIHVKWSDYKYGIGEEIIAEYYNKGNEPELEKFFPKQQFLQNIELPLFEQKRHWPVTRRHFY